MELWPSNIWMVRMSTPASRRWVAKQWRRVCGVTCFSMPAFPLWRSQFLDFDSPSLEGSGVRRDTERDTECGVFL